MRTFLLVLMALACFGCTQQPTSKIISNKPAQPASITHLSAPPGWKIARLEGTATLEGDVTHLPTVVMIRQDNPRPSNQLAAR